MTTRRIAAAGLAGLTAVVLLGGCEASEKSGGTVKPASVLSTPTTTPASTATAPTTVATARPTTTTTARATTTTTYKVTASTSSSVYYQNCTAVRAAGKDPIYRGEPGYASHLDRDNDGIGCE